MDVTKIFADMETGLVWGTPSTQLLVWIRGWTGDGSEKVHSPVGALGGAVVNVEEAQGNLDFADPALSGLVQRRSSREAIGSRIRDEKVIERRALGSIFGRVVDKRLIRHVVWIDLELQVGLGIFGTLVDESFHDFVRPYVVIGALLGVEVEVGFVVRGKGQDEGAPRVAKVHLREREFGLVRDRLGVPDGADLGASWNVDMGEFDGVGQV